MELELDGVTWTGPAPDEPHFARLLPLGLRSVLSAVNGFILHGGALHVRGIVSSLKWHSLQFAWRGEFAIAKLYPDIRQTDVPFGQDCVGDQFLLREGRVVRLNAETGDIEPTGCSLNEFLRAASRSPVETLLSQPLAQFQAEGGELLPGRGLHAFPPFCTADSKNGVSLRDISIDELLRVHAEFAAQIRGVPDGGRIRIVASGNGG